jgi:hypothetical protein
MLMRLDHRLLCGPVQTKTRPTSFSQGGKYGQPRAFRFRETGRFPVSDRLLFCCDRLCDVVLSMKKPIPVKVALVAFIAGLSIGVLIGVRA